LIDYNNLLILDISILHFDDAENIPEEIKTYFYTGDSPEDYLSDCDYD